MILPDKYLPLEDSYLGLGARILSAMREPIRLDKLWGRFSKDSHVDSFDRFITTLDILYYVGLIEFGPNHLLRRTHA